MPKFLVTVSRDATAHFTAVVEAKNLSEIQDRMHSKGFEGDTLTDWACEVSTYDHVESYSVANTDKNELYERVIQ